MTTHSKWDRRFAAVGLVDLEARADADQAVLARIEAELNPTCPICGDDRDSRLPYCSAECCAEDEETDLSPTGSAGDRRPCSLCRAPGAPVKGRNPHRRFCSVGCAALANEIDCTQRTPTADELRAARARVESSRAANATRRALEITFSMPDLANALLRGVAR